MHNQGNSLQQGASFAGSANIMPPPPMEQGINIKAAQIAGGLQELNTQLAMLRAKLFGEAESAPPQAPTNGPLPSVAGCLCDCEAFLGNAHAQVSSILNRL